MTQWLPNVTRVPDGNLCHSFTMLLTGFQQDAVRTPCLILIGIRSQAKPAQWAAYMGNLPLIYYSEHSLGCSSHRNVTEISKHSSMHLKRNLQILKATVFFLFFRFLSSKKLLSCLWPLNWPFFYDIFFLSRKLLQQSPSCMHNIKLNEIL